MLYHILFSLHERISFFNIFQYLTFRNFAAFLTAFLFCFISGPRFIRRLQSAQMKQAIREEGPQSHFSKKGTPTMGGSLILLSILFPTVLWADSTNPYVWVSLFIGIGYGLIGYFDDLLKVSKKNPKGLSGKLRLVLEFLLALIACAYAFKYAGLNTDLYFPFLKKLEVDLGWGYIFFGAFVIVGAANAVNLTDGLDGLAIGPVMINAITLGIFAYLAGNIKIANYLQIPYVAGVGELSILLSSVAAAGLGFLWYNTYPAQVFMGDVGSLSLGGIIGTAAVLTKNEFLLVLLGGIFVVEALSVITQVAYFKRTGKRIFKMAPIHHHFELKGWAEPRVVVRFWIISILLAVLSLATLKIR